MKPWGLALLGSAALVGAAQGAKWTAIEKLPRAVPVEVIVRDQPRVYFRVTAESPVVVPLEGPIRLRVISRVELPAGSHEVAKYRLNATDGSTTFGTLDTESAAATVVRLAAGESAVGKSRHMMLDVPAGSHQITLGLSHAGSVLVRLEQASPGGGSPMVTLTPVVAARSVTVAEGEKLLPYYSVLPGQPVTLRLVGPTTLQLLSRLDFDATMRGSQSYRLRVTEHGAVIHEIAFKTTKATTASYTNLADHVPSKFDQSTLAFGDGLHEIQIAILEPARGSVEIHARIAEVSVGNEE